MNASEQKTYDPEVAASIEEERQRLIRSDAQDSLAFRAGMCRAIAVILLCSVVATGTGVAYALTEDRACRAIAIAVGIYGAGVFLIAIGEAIAECRRARGASLQGRAALLLSLD